MSVAPNSGIIDFSTFTPPSGGQDGIQGQVPKPLAGQGGYVLTGSGWSSLGALGVISYQGTWNAATNTPTIVSGVGTQGYYYVVSVAGTTTIDGISNWGVGDWIIFNGATWQKIEGGSQGNFTTLDVTGQSSLGTGSANSLTINGAAGGSSPTIQATGSDTNVGLNLTTKGAGTVNIAAANITGGTINNTAIGATTPAAGNFTATRINQPWDEGTGRLQVNGQAAIEGNAVVQDVVVQGGNNLFQRSQEFDNTSFWSVSSVATISSNTLETLAPNNTNTADKLLETTITDGHRVSSNNVTTLAGVNYTISIFAKAAERNFLFIRTNLNGNSVNVAWFDLLNGSVGTVASGFGFTANIVSVGNGWYRCSVSRVSVPVAIFVGFGCSTVDNEFSYSGDPTKGIYIWGAQLEQGTVASPYTPTTSAAVTTTNDVFVPSGQVLTGNGTASLPSYSALGDTNTGMFFPAADTLAISTGGSERVRVDSSGNVLVGATSEIANVSIGDKRIYLDALSSAELVLYSRTANDNSFSHLTFGGIRSSTGASARISANRRGLIVFGNNDAASGVNTVNERLRITSGGTIIIGNGETAASPNNALLQATGGEGTNITGATLTIQGGRGTGSAAGGPIVFSTSAAGSSGTTLNAATERVRVKPTGQVRFQPLAADPANAESGDVYYNSVDNKLKCYNGTAWTDLF